MSARADEDHSYDFLKLDRIPTELASPWTTSARPWLLAGGGLTVSLLILEDQVSDPLQIEVRERNRLWGLSKIGDLAGQVIPNATYMAGMLGAYFITENPKYLEHSVIMLKATAYSSAATTILKYAIREPRPNGRDWLSFPSGHSTTAFAFASVVTSEHGLFPYGAAAIALASLTGFSRINDNAHYLHDVIAGATIGTAFGLGVSRMNQQLDAATKQSESKISLMPVVAPGLYSMNMLVSFP